MTQIQLPADEQEEAAREYEQAKERADQAEIEEWEAQQQPGYVPKQPEEPEYLSRLVPMRDDQTGPYTEVNGTRMTSVMFPNPKHPSWDFLRPYLEAIPPSMPDRLNMAIALHAMDEKKKGADAQVSVVTEEPPKLEVYESSKELIKEIEDATADTEKHWSLSQIISEYENKLSTDNIISVEVLNNIITIKLENKYV